MVADRRALTVRFEEILAAGGPLDQGALLIAAHGRPDLDIDASLTRLDELADSVSEPTLDGLLRRLFRDGGFSGNQHDYYDPENSFLDRVIERRTGIPITLAVLTLEVGRRLGVPLDGVAMPGHFLVRDRVDRELFVDVFRSGARLDRAGCGALFRQVTGSSTDPLPEHLEPVGPLVILRRILGNLDVIYSRRGDRTDLAWVRMLEARFPGTPPDARREVAQLFASTGRFHEAGRELTALAALLGGEEADVVRREAERLFARLN